LGEHVHSRLPNRGRRGQALIELAVSLPILLLIVTGIATFGIAFNNYLSLTNAVTIGGQILSVSRGQTTDPCATAATAIHNAAPLLNSTGISLSFNLNGVGYPGASCDSAGAVGNLASGATAQVTATYPCSLIVYGANLSPGCTLTAQIAEIVQ
jgi:Flp pilus assembly protein TadG